MVNRGPRQLVDLGAPPIPERGHHVQYGSVDAPRLLLDCVQPLIDADQILAMMAVVDRVKPLAPRASHPGPQGDVAPHPGVLPPVGNAHHHRLVLIDEVVPKHRILEQDLSMLGAPELADAPVALLPEDLVLEAALPVQLKLLHNQAKDGGAHQQVLLIFPNYSLV